MTGPVMRPALVSSIHASAAHIMVAAIGGSCDVGRKLRVIRGVVQGDGAEAPRLNGFDDVG